ncbi:MAG: ATPase [Pseudomonadota bacterium]
MIYTSARAYLDAPQKAVALFGMSGLGKTCTAQMLRAEAEWFHYSVDFRIGTRYMGEHIVDNFKREAMRNPFLRQLLKTDSIYIASNITFENLDPLSTYLGKPGNPEKGGIPFEEYVRRQRQHHDAEVKALRDTGAFIAKAREIYGYRHFLCDTGGSICEVVDPDDPEDRVMSALAQQVLLVQIRGTEALEEALVARFLNAPKPMYYPEDVLRQFWAEYLAETGEREARVDPDHFIAWGFRRLLQRRLPRYDAMARRWGVSIEAHEIEAVKTPADFDALIAEAIDRKTRGDA